MELKDQLGTAADDFYAALIDAHAGLSIDESHALNARLVLMLANEVGDFERLKTVLNAATAYSTDAS